MKYKIIIFLIFFFFFINIIMYFSNGGYQLIYLKKLILKFQKTYGSENLYILFKFKFIFHFSGMDTREKSCPHCYFLVINLVKLVEKIFTIKFVVWISLGHKLTIILYATRGHVVRQFWLVLLDLNLGQAFIHGIFNWFLGPTCSRSTYLP